VKLGRILGVAAVLGFAAFVFYSLLQVEPVQVMSPRLEHGASGVFLSGAVKNTSSHEEAVDVEIRYYDSSGHQVATDTVKIAHLGSGETRDFAAPPRALAGVSSYSVYLNHGRNPYGN
jgi:hypothetical protein